MYLLTKVQLFSTQARQLSTTRHLLGEVRVRFAPSPTGSIHLGGLRTALYNYLFAKKLGGKFILRIEDTDQPRTIPGSMEEIEETLDWAGLYRNEGPQEGGPFGPYMQSQRIDLYKRKAEDLLQAGKAYRCFCSPMRLELLRKHQVRNREPPHYDGKCRHLTHSEIDQKMEESDGKFVIRFALEPGPVQFEDMIFGPIHNQIEARVDSDPIIMKSDGFPTYHFANVVDDHSMNISHVLRGSEWLSSTSKHLSIYRAFQWNEPKFAHFPLIVMKDGSKMSKRDNRNRVKFMREQGYRPLAVINFLTNMGGGLPKDKQDSHELWDLDKLAQVFDFHQVSSHSASVDLNRLNIFNSKDLQLSWTHSPEKVVDEFKSLLKMRSMKTDMTDERLIETVGLFITRIERLSDLISSDYAFIWHPPTITWDKDFYLQQGWDLNGIIADVIESINLSEDLSKEKIDCALRCVAQRHGIDWPPMFRLIRKLLTNSDRGLPVHELVSYLGKQRFVEYMESGSKSLCL